MGAGVTMNPMMKNKTPAEIAAIRAKSTETRKRNIAIRESEKKRKADEACELSKKIKRLQKELLNLEDAHRLAFASMALCGNSLLPPHEISANAHSIGKNSGVYFLVSNGDVVYVGQSVSVFSRVQQHIGRINFDSFSWIACDKEGLDVLESIYIHHIKPKENGRLSTGEIIAPLKIGEILKMAGIHHGKSNTDKPA